jgi:hypothetical protein
MTDWAGTQVEDFLAKYPTPSVEGLCFLLRHSEFWPEDFEWDYGQWDTCAMGLAKDTWGLQRKDPAVSWLKTVCDAIGITVHYGRQAFEYAADCLPEYDTGEDEKVPPGLVADELQYWYGRQMREMAA